MGFLGKKSAPPKTDGANPPKGSDVSDPGRAGASSPLGGRVVPPLTRKLSVISQKTVETLEGLEEQLDSMKLHCDEAEHDLNNPGEDGFRAGLRGDLATMHGSRASQLPASQRLPISKLFPALPPPSLAGNANRLLATRLDAILTSELTSGRDAARTKRKVLIGQSEALIDRCEVLVKRYDTEKDATGVAAARPEPDAAPSEH